MKTRNLLQRVCVNMLDVKHETANFGSYFEDLIRCVEYLLNDKVA
jgi:hypothetical protein